MFAGILILMIIKILVQFPLIISLANFWLSFLFMFLQVLFFTTAERKFLALTQRRVGPEIVGTRGRLQYFADAIKMLIKLTFSPRKVSSLFFYGAAVATFWLSWFGFCNLTFGPGIDVAEIEYNIFYGMCTSLAFSIFWLAAGWAAESKYSMLGCLRASIQIMCYEILSSIVLLHVFLITGTSNFEIISDMQEYCPIIIFLPTIGLVSFFSTLMETNRPPFDLSEAESDLVAGYVVEYAGITFGLFYLGEYVNLFTGSIVLSIIFLGSWWTVLSCFDNFLTMIYFFFTTDGFSNYFNISVHIKIENLPLCHKDLVTSEYKFLSMS